MWFSLKIIIFKKYFKLSQKNSKKFGPPVQSNPQELEASYNMGMIFVGLFGLKAVDLYFQWNSDSIVNFYKSWKILILYFVLGSARKIFSLCKFSALYSYNVLCEPIYIYKGAFVKLLLIKSKVEKVTMET